MKTFLYDLDEIQVSDLNNLSRNEELQKTLLERVPNRIFTELEIRDHAKKLLEYVKDPTSSFDIGDYAIKNNLDVLEFFNLCHHPYFSLHLEDAFCVFIYRFSSAFDQGLISKEEFDKYKRIYSSTSALRMAVEERKRNQFKIFGMA